MSEALDLPKYTGEADHWKDAEKAFNSALAAGAASADAQLVALAIRAGLAELSVDISQVRAFGTGRAKQ